MTTLLVIVIADLVVRSGLLVRQAFSTPPEIVRALFDQLRTRTYWLAVWNTMKGWALGLGLAILVGIPLGILVGTSRLPLPLRFAS